eukprot:SAG31_NODE_39499_length_287_cov_2.117021_1_plen_64_part_01
MSWSPDGFEQVRSRPYLGSEWVKCAQSFCASILQHQLLSVVFPTVPSGAVTADTHAAYLKGSRG